MRASSLFIVWALVLPLGCSRSANRVVVYCALDREFAEPILEAFSKQSGLEMVPRFDTEANKSVGLYEDLIREANSARCDVHWNNEILATIRLQQKGVLAPYDSPAAAPFPAAFRAKEHTWTAFAARARVFIVNTTKVDKQALPRGMLDLVKPEWKGRVAMAKPLFGTTATHGACLFQTWGADKARDFYEKLKNNNVLILPGNKQVAVAVGLGQMDVGMTDTDDAMAEIDQGRPVTMVFPDADGSGTLFIPNTVALITNAPNPAGGKRLIDYLLSPEVEAKLAENSGRQIPLNPAVKVQLPAVMAPARTARVQEVDFVEATKAWEESQRFFKDKFALN